jgi:hypothetical protein
MRIEPLKPPHFISLPGTPDEETLNAFTKTAACVEQEALGHPLVVSYTNDVAIPQTLGPIDIQDSHRESILIHCASH